MQICEPFGKDQKVHLLNLGNFFIFWKEMESRGILTA